MNSFFVLLSGSFYYGFTKFAHYFQVKTNIVHLFLCCVCLKFVVSHIIWLYDLTFGTILLSNPNKSKMINLKTQNMKRIILSFAILMTGAVAANAQTSFGIKAGLNISNLRGDDVAGGDVKSLIGANGGLYAHIPAGTNFAVQPELLYSMEGAKAKNSDIKTELNYVNVPVMLQYVNPSGFYAELGPQIGFLTSAKVKTGSVSSDIKNELATINLSAGAGLGYNFTPAIGAGVRYMLGLTRLGDNDPKADIKTSNLAVGLHYTFGK